MKRFAVCLAAGLVACGKAAPPAVDLEALVLRVEARAAEINGLKEKAKADSRHNPTRVAIALDGLQERLLVLRRQLDTLKAAGPTPDDQLLVDFENAYTDLAAALREYKALYLSPPPAS
ncbi:MAG: hypothetical protein IPN65_08770 [Elusimicrobia bacterium]|nr:hypothetical protein [Elusimicrobiota bacterium]MBK7207886.1 hypothetical protein [Elusimicrobiota bacterium]MBK7544651.1 hypothetical protein [Elusimicrobiota bacterium]MBK7574183.1 hypothetical protein [Elusimicrobiota bacterium]MBK7688876.1 hypothetical protein [Elusimicrobiota bacterium]